MLPLITLLFASTLWGLVWLPLRALESMGMPGLWISFVSYAVILIPSSIWLIRQKHWFRSDGSALLVIALFAGWCNVAFNLAILQGDVVRVLILFYLSPLWSILLGRIFLGETMSAGAKTVFALALTGMFLMLWSPQVGFPWPRDSGDWLALSSGLSFSIANVSIRGSHVPVSVKTIATWAGVMLVAGTGILIQSPSVPAISVETWMGAAALGIFGFMAMTTAVQYGVSHLPLHVSAVILLFELVVGTVSAQLLTDEKLIPREWIGGVLILVSGLMSATMHYKKSS